MKWLADYFNLTKGEKRGFTVLIGIVVVLMGLPYGLPHFMDTNKGEAFTGMNEAMIRYETGVAAMDTAVPDKSPERTENIEYFSFDPNKLAVEGWLKLGLDEKTAHIIANYREAGGEFNVKADLKNIYGLHDSTYQRLRDYIDLPEQNNEATSPPAEKATTTGKTTEANQPGQEKSTEEASSTNSPENRKAGTLVELNKADTAALQTIYGIGSVYAERLTKYKKLLGGFHQKSQLLEIYGIDSAQFEQIAPQAKVAKEFVEKLSLNEADFETLNAHPYLEYSDVLAIVNYRDKVDSVKTPKELLKQRIIGQELFEKIGPYLTP